MPLLQTTDLSVTFGALRANDQISIAVEHGALVGLIGPNGAGKTTFIDALTGFVPSRGTITLGGREMSRLPAHRRAHAGLGRTWQSLELFDDLTVAENLQVAAERQSVRGFMADIIHPRRSRDGRAVEDAITTTGLAHLVDRMPNELSQGEAKLVGVARALAARPKIVCMDEPAAGLDTSESQTLGHALRHVVVDRGVAILLVDHDMGLVLTVCDYVYVLEFGQVIAEGPPDAIRANDRVIAAYLGAGARRD
jgi:branched-chain amino acid transport system ATP-binding protein